MSHVNRGVQVFDAIPSCSKNTHMYDNYQGCVLNIVMYLIGVSNHDN